MGHVYHSVASLLLLTTVSKHLGTDVTNFRERNAVLLLFHIRSSCSTALGSSLQYFCFTKALNAFRW